MNVDKTSVESLDILVSKNSGNKVLKIPNYIQ